MSPATILVVEDFASTRKLIRVTLERAGYVVLEAGDGRAALDILAKCPVHLILLDLMLPDMDGLDLAKQLGALPETSGTPIVACSASLARLEQARGMQIGFLGFIYKPVEPSELLETVKAHLAPMNAARMETARGRRILVANDDPLSLKLLRAHLEQVGFDVMTAQDGQQALELARRSPPDAIVSDVLMPHLDGFKLCLAIRQDGKLSGLPVVLFSSAYTEEEDRRLAKSVGASALTLATPDFRETLAALHAALGHPPEARDLESAKLGEEYTYRVVRQLERQAGSTMSLTRRLAMRDAELGILASLTAAMERASSFEEVLNQLLYACLDVAEFTKGVLYLVDRGGSLTLWAEMGFFDLAQGGLSDFFGHAALLTQTLDGGEPRVMRASEATENTERELLEECRARSLLIVPIRSGEQPVGVLVMAAADETAGESWLPFATALSGHVGQAINLAQTMARLRENEHRLECIVQSLAEGVLILDRDGCVCDVNHAAERIFGLPRAGLLGKSGNNLLPLAEDLPWSACDVEQEITRPHGDPVVVLRNYAELRDDSQALAGSVVTLHDITERKLADTLQQQARELARSNAELEQFAHVVAHDLQEPLRGLAGFAQLLAGRNQSQLDAKSLDFLKRIVDSAARMQRLIKDLLAYARAGKAGFKPCPVECEEVFSAALANLNAVIEEAGAEVVHEPLPALHADPVQLGQVFQNLISNAIKFRDRQSPRVEVCACRQGAEWTFSVRDYGIGFEAEHAARIFKAFERLHSQAAYPGSGIGLATCKKIIERHGGRIWVESEPGSGSTFRFTIPAGSPPGGPAA